MTPLFKSVKNGYRHRFKIFRNQVIKGIAEDDKIQTERKSMEKQRFVKILNSAERSRDKQVEFNMNQNPMSTTIAVQNEFLPVITPTEEPISDGYTPRKSHEKLTPILKNSMSKQKEKETFTLQKPIPSCFDSIEAVDVGNVPLFTERTIKSPPIQEQLLKRANCIKFKEQKPEWIPIDTFPAPGMVNLKGGRSRIIEEMMKLQKKKTGLVTLGRRSRRASIVSIPDRFTIDFSAIIDDLWLNNIETIKSFQIMDKKQTEDMTLIRELSPKERLIRATAIEKICKCASDLDKSVIFTAVNFLDRYYCSKKLKFQNLEMACLNAVVALAVIAEEDIEVPTDFSKRMFDSLQSQHDWNEIALAEEDIKDFLLNGPVHTTQLETLHIIGVLVRKSLEKVIPDGMARSKVLNLLKPVEFAVEDFLKATLVDSQLIKFGQSMIVFALFAAILEIKLREITVNPYQNFSHLRAFNQLFDRIVLEIYGDLALNGQHEDVLPFMDDFGRYVILRQKRIYEAFGNSEGQINHVYNTRTSKMFKMDSYDQVVKERLKECTAHPKRDSIRIFKDQLVKWDATANSTKRSFDIDVDMEQVFSQTLLWCVNPVGASFDTKTVPQH